MADIQIQQPTVWYMSRRFWGSAVALAPVAMGLAGMQSDWLKANQDKVIDAIMLVVSGVGSLVALYGSLKAKGPMTLTRQPHDSKLGTLPSVPAEVQAALAKANA
jgi:hypothetical protein